MISAYPVPLIESFKIFRPEDGIEFLERDRFLFGRHESALCLGLAGIFPCVQELIQLIKLHNLESCFVCADLLSKFLLPDPPVSFDVLRGYLAAGHMGSL